jgi:hypothetical protein
MVAEQVAAIVAVNKRAAKLGISEAYTFTMGEPFVEHVHTDEGRGFDVELVTFIITGQPLRYNGWTFGGTVDWTVGEPIVRRSRGLDESISLAAPSDKRCDHCDTMRSRKDTYLVVQENGDVKQVGSGCLEAYTGMKPAMVGISDGPELLDWDARNVEWTWAPGYVVQVAAALLSKHAYRKVGDGYSTRDIVGDVMRETQPETRKVVHDALGEAIRTVDDEFDNVADEAAAVLEWMRSLRGSSSEYEDALAKLADAPVVTARHLGYLCSAVVVFKRSQQQARERAERGPVETGNGVKVTGKVVGCKVHESAYGETWKLTIQTENGSRVWVSLPSSLEEAWWQSQQDAEYGAQTSIPDWFIGKGITFVANVEASRDDETFGFAKRPRKAELV